MTSDRHGMWVPLSEAGAREATEVGGKARALGRLIEAGVPVPDGIAVTTAAYRTFVEHDGLGARIELEIDRKAPGDSRWEELWDASLRIRSLVMAAEVPAELAETLVDALEQFGDAALVVRSSSPHEDAGDRSFAGLHDSVVGVSGVDDALEAIRTVWASLWSDRAMLYRAETQQGSDASMAVVIQRLASSERSGVAFTRSPVDRSAAVVEAVWGLGEGLVSGAVEPDRYALARDTGAVIGHETPSERDVWMVRAERGVSVEPLPDEFAARAPLDPEEATEVWGLASRAERAFGSAQDTEWTYDAGTPLLTQARPITSGLPDDERSWYLTLTPSYERLEELRSRIEHHVLPAMRSSAERLAAADLGGATEEALAAHADDVISEVHAARQAYRDDLIPFAHGARLFGSFYNGVVHPKDAYEFTALLVRDGEGQLERQRLLAQLGVSWSPPATDDAELERRIEAFLGRFEDDDERDAARRMLHLGRRSWALRDDDNLYLDLVEREATRTLAEIGERPDSASLRAARRRLEDLAEGSLDSNRSAAEDPGHVQAPRVEGAPRQLVGQPAGPGVARGPARVIESRADIAELRDGDVLVIDALEPDTAAFASRAAAIVERRGGMLVHGAIVAREWGLPCVTGVPRATELIIDGEPLVVDGFLGIVTRSAV